MRAERLVELAALILIAGMSAWQRLRTPALPPGIYLADPGAGKTPD